VAKADVHGKGLGRAKIFGTIRQQLSRATEHGQDVALLIATEVRRRHDGRRGSGRMARCWPHHQCQ
jgi:hypothetical protein